METIQIKNPVIPGFYSDPSTVRVGEDFYLVTSTFEFFPGVPVFHSRDLINWEQISNCLSRPSQLDLSRAGVSDGIYAPTLRFHSGVFYMVTSNRCAGTGNHFYVTATDPHGPWSDPVWVTEPDGSIPGGVDPSLFFDEDGRVYFSCVAWDGEGQGIGQAEIDLSTGRLREPLRVVWHGTGGTFPEGPHTYRIGGWYYLMIAEGGTEFGHKVTIARARDIAGPYESCPHNPILTQTVQKAQSCAVQGVGHGDLVEDANGGWWLIVHGFRPSIGKLHHLGRETVLAPVVWSADGWPVVNGKGWLDDVLTIPAPAPGACQKPLRPFSIRFGGGPLPLCLEALRAPGSRHFSLSGDGLALLGTAETLDSTGSPAWLGVRQQAFCCRAAAVLDYEPREGEEAGLTVYQTSEHHYDIVVTRRSGRKCAFLRRRVGDICVESPACALAEGTLTLEIAADEEQYSFACEAGGARTALGTGRTQLLSTEAMQYQNFTGTFLALYAVCPAGAPTPAVFRTFSCTPVSAI